MARPSPEAVKARLLVLRELARRRLQAIRDRTQRRKAPLLLALEEFRRNRAWLEGRRAEGQLPEAILRPALEREELRIAHLEAQLRRLEERAQAQGRAYLQRLRLKAARLGARAGVEVDLEALFGELERGLGALEEAEDVVRA